MAQPYKPVVGSTALWGSNTPQEEIDAFNMWLNQQPWWQQIKARSGGGNLSDDQRKEIQLYLMNQAGLPLSNNFEIDKAGNVNQKGMPTWKKALIGAGIAGATATGLGAAGVGPMAGLLHATAPAVAGGGAAAGTTAASTAAGSALPSFGIVTGTKLPVAVGGIKGAAKAIGGRYIDGLMGGMGDKRSTPFDIASAFGAYAGAQAHNRGGKADLAQIDNANSLQAIQERRAAETDALRKIRAGSYIMGGGSNWTMPTQARSGPLTDFGLGPVPITQAEKDAAATLQSQLMDRLQPGAGWQPTSISQFGEPGKGEKVANAASLISTIFSPLWR